VLALLASGQAGPARSSNTAPALPPFPNTNAGRMKDHYTALGLASDASLADIKKAFRQKAAQYHPDRNSADDAAERFRAVQEAYEVLSDDAKRQAYDDNRRRNLLDDPAATAREIWQAYFSPLRQPRG
jgi:curved DNA-binding protein CbpA